LNLPKKFAFFSNKIPVSFHSSTPDIILLDFAKFALKTSTIAGGCAADFTLRIVSYQGVVSIFTGRQ
jgi:hypothetical protein